MNTIIYIIRHGEVDNPKGVVYGRTVDVKLTNKGANNVEELAVIIKNNGISPEVIFSSDLTRTVQTALIIQRVFGGQVPIIKEKNLEETDCSSFEGKLEIKELEAVGGDIYSYGRSKNISVETMEQIATRMLSVISKIIKAYPGKTIFVVSHGDPTAITMWKLVHPKANLPPIVKLENELYLQLSTAWKTEFDEQGNFLNYKFIGKE